MQNYVYTKAHLGVLKKYRTVKMSLLLTGCFILFLQSLSWIIVWMRDMKATTSDMIFVTITLGVSFLFIISQLHSIIKNRKIISGIQANGEYQTWRTSIKFSNKYSLVGGFVLFCRIIAIVLVILLGVMCVNFITNYINWGKVILKMPLMLLFVLEFLTTSAELRFHQLVEKVK